MACSRPRFGDGGGDCPANDGQTSSIASISSSTRKRKLDVKLDVNLSNPSIPQTNEPFKIKEVAEVFRNLSGQRAEIVRHLKFSGLTMLPQCDQGRTSLLNREFSLWLMNNVDVEARSIDLGPRGRIPMLPEDVQRVFGFPCKGQEILPCRQDGMDHTIEKVKKILLIDISDKLNMAAIEHIVLRKYPFEMCNKHRIAFLVAVVIYAVSYFLAPRGNPPELNCDVLPYLIDPVSAFSLNWSQYVLDVLIESCKNVQRAKYWSDKKSCTLDGCLLLLQIFYLDNLDFGPSKIRHFNRPRVADFSCSILDKLFALDTNSSSTNDINKFGITEIRYPTETIYTYGNYYRTVSARLSIGGAETDEKHFQYLKDYSKWFIWEQKKKIREMTDQFAIKLCKQLDASQKSFMCTAKEWFISRKRRILLDVCRLQEEGRQFEEDSTNETNSSESSDTDGDSGDNEEEFENIAPDDGAQPMCDQDDGNRTPIVKLLNIEDGYGVGFEENVPAAEGTVARGNDENAGDNSFCSSDEDI